MAVAEAFLLVGLSMPLWADRVEHLPPPAESTRVRVVAEQFAWNVHYPGPDGVFGRTDPKLIDAQANPLGLDREDPAAKDDVTTINQLHLPVDRPALLTLTSKDVIHSFALQEMRVKQDVIPGIVGRGVVRAQGDDRGDAGRARATPSYNYEISCAQLCGLGHYRMRGYVTIHRPEAFQKWMDEQQAQLARGGRGVDLELSAVLFLFLCHLGIGIVLTMLLISGAAGVRFFRFTSALAFSSIVLGIALRPAALTFGRDARGLAIGRSPRDPPRPVPRRRPPEPLAPALPVALGRERPPDPGGPGRLLPVERSPRA